MAEGKKSFLLYSDLIFTVNKLTDEQAGNLFKHILSYVNDENPVADNIVTEIAFEPIRQYLKRDLQKYKGKCLKNTENANMRWNKENANASDGIKASIEPPVKPPAAPVMKETEAEKFVLTLPDEWKPVVKEWLEYKRVKKQSYKSQASLTAMLKMLRKKSGDSVERAKEIVDHSTGNNYDGLFAPKVSNFMQAGKIIQPKTDEAKQALLNRMK